MRETKNEKFFLSTTAEIILKNDTLKVFVFSCTNPENGSKLFRRFGRRRQSPCLRTSLVRLTFIIIYGPSFRLTNALSYLDTTFMMNKGLITLVAML
jgi:hypothetical protein